MQTQENVQLPISPQKDNSGKRLSTTGAKTLQVQNKADQIIEMDDIECDLDENLDDEHYNGGGTTTTNNCAGG